MDSSPWLRRSFLVLFLTLPVFAASEPPVDAQVLFRQLRQSPGNPVFLEQLRLLVPSLTNRPEREVALAVYGLGCLINEDLGRAQKARDVLAREFPGSHALDLFTADALYTSCPRCGSEGHAQREFCDTCKGGRRCAVCGGKGKIKSLSSPVACSACNGSGRCRACEGTGRKKTNCPRCSGAGRVLDGNEVRRTSYGLLQEYLNPDGPAREDGTPPGEGKARRRRE